MMKKALFCLLCVILLEGCVPAAFVVGAAAGGAIIYDHRSVGTMAQDHDITAVAQNRIDTDFELKTKASISVAVFNRIVLVVGQAPTQELRDRAEGLVKAVANVRLVYNEITIENPLSKTEEANDSWITSKVKTVLFAEKDLNSSQMKIVTENAVVYMMGLTTRTQAKIATQRASTVVGVKKIVKLFEYIS